MRKDLQLARKKKNVAEVEEKPKKNEQTHPSFRGALLPGQ